MEDKKLSEKESIELIATMISRTRERYMGANILLLWGYLTVGVTILVWALLATTGNPAWNWLWFLIWIVGGSVTPVLARKNELRCGVKSYTDRITSQIWSVVGYSGLVAFAIYLILMLGFSVSCWSMWLVYALVIVPFAEISQGIIIREKALIVGGAVGLAIGLFTLCCIAGGITLYARWFLVLFMIAFTAMMIVPGHILKHKKQ